MLRVEVGDGVMKMVSSMAGNFEGTCVYNVFSISFVILIEYGVIVCVIDLGIVSVV